MEHCPNCSTPARPGAKFCTACGFRFDGCDESSGTTTPVTLDGLDRPDPDYVHDNDDSDSGGWPAALAPSDAPPNDKILTRSESAPNEFETEVAESSEYVGFWPEPSSDPWPAPLTASSEGTERHEPSPAPSTQVVASPSTPELAAHADHPASGRDNAHDLLDRLRESIDAMAEQALLDLSGVISDLEVAVTPPGALPPDDVAELREALFAAREHPRDIDTVLDLTKRIDTLVALAIAYDRAIAAIERSLNALKRTEHPAN